MVATYAQNGNPRLEWRLPAEVDPHVAVATAVDAPLQWRLPADVDPGVAVAQEAPALVWRLPPDVAPASPLTPANGAAPAAQALDWRDDVGSEPSFDRPAVVTPAATLDNNAIYRIVREVAYPLSGDDLYAATEADEQLGLLYGLVLFPQASVHLGSVLRLMRARAEAVFLDVFGAAADELLAVTGAPTPTARLQPVERRFLWQEPWLSRFRRAGAVPAFQAAQNEEAIEHQFRPMLRPALELGLATERGLAVAYDAVATRGVGGGIRWLVESAGPLATDRQRTHALSLLGFASVAAFQASVEWLPQDGVFGPETHAALVGALRRQGDLPLPTANDLVLRLVDAAEGDARLRLEQLAGSSALDDETAVTA
jgi:hypothetical protein